MTPVHAIASVLLVGMGYSVWRGFNPKGKSEKPGPHNGWRNQEHAARSTAKAVVPDGWTVPPHQSDSAESGGDGK
ncbi:hypothetical protein [Sphingopyxis sp.]|jgi:hypothetical protein|uniref:hypothetical protein n=1 Tax=Sphingopyxis sp. TaxID=1908224 RepID=UPI002DEB700A|nr:hypothetical protein [Sphingopyxis sp.]